MHGVTLPGTIFFIGCIQRRASVRKLISGRMNAPHQNKLARTLPPDRRHAAARNPLPVSRPRTPHLRQARGVQLHRQHQGPHGAVHPAARLRQRRDRARRRDRRGDQRQHRHLLRGHRPRARSPGAHLHAGLDEPGTRAGDPEPGRRGDSRVRRARRVPRFHPHGGRFRARRARPRVPSAAVRQQRQRAGALRNHGAGDHRAAGDAGPHAHGLRRRRGHRRHRDGRGAPPARALRQGRRGASARARQFAHAAHRPQGRPSPHPGHQRRVRAVHRASCRNWAGSSTSGTATPS